MWVGPKNVLEPDPTPNLANQGPKSAKRAPNGPELKAKKGLYPLIWSCYSILLGPKTDINMISAPQLAHQCPNNLKGAPNWVDLKSER